MSKPNVMELVLTFNTKFCCQLVDSEAVFRLTGVEPLVLRFELEDP